VPEGSPEQIEGGLTVSPSHQGRGLGTEALRGLVAYVFGTLGVHRLFASADPRNEPSLRMMRAAGLRQEAHHRRSLRIRGEWVDDVVWALLREEWEATAPGSTWLT
jgi:RimJ/RimL family protein N-acetyltransferase